MFSFIFELFAWFFAGLTVLSVVGFVVYSAYLGRKLAWDSVKYIWGKWKGRQVSSAKDRIKKRVGMFLIVWLFSLLISCGTSMATPGSAMQVRNTCNAAGTPIAGYELQVVVVTPVVSPTPTWNATTTPTQPPTATPTATNTPDMYRSDVRYIRFSDYPTPLSNLVIPAASPTPIVFAATTPGYHHKIEACAQNIGTAAGVLTAGGMTYNFSPYDPRTLFLFTPANGAITIDTSYVAGVTIRLNLMHAIVRDGQ